MVTYQAQTGTFQDPQHSLNLSKWVGGGVLWLNLPSTGNKPYNTPVSFDDTVDGVIKATFKQGSDVVNVTQTKDSGATGDLNGKPFDIKGSGVWHVYPPLVAEGAA